MRKRSSIIKVAVLCALLIVLAGILLYSFGDRLFRNREAVPQDVVVREILALYVPKPTGTLERRNLEVVRPSSFYDKAQRILRELSALKVVPEKLALYDIASDPGGVLVINLSREFLEARPSSLNEVTMVYAIVNSFLMNFRDMTRVFFLVEGKPIYTVNGTLHMYQSLEFNKELLED